MAHLHKHGKKWQAIVRKKKIVAIKSFWKKSDASKWAYHVEAQIETGTYKRVKDAERLADIRLSEILNIYYEKHIKVRSRDPLKEKSLIDLVTRLLGKKYITDLTGNELALRDCALIQSFINLLTRYI